MSNAKKRKPRKTAGLDYELTYSQHGYRFIVGIDEAGRGAWAGPVAAGAVCLPIADSHLRERLEGVRDSKQLTARSRAELVETIKTTALAWGVGDASSAEIDRIGIAAATRLAMRRALFKLMESQPTIQPDLLLLDFVKWQDAPIACPQHHLKKGDQLSLTIAAASILAKTWRDEYMRDLERQYNGYEFARHKGYGTPQHSAALKSRGVTPVHRTTFAPVRSCMQGEPLI
jgi:ribonuclease HII